MPSSVFGKRIMQMPFAYNTPCRNIARNSRATSGVSSHAAVKIFSRPITPLLLIG